MFDIDEIRKQALASMRETMEKNEERISKIEVPSSEKGASVSAAEVEEQIAANTQRQVEILGQMFGPDSMAQMAVNEELLQKMVNDKVAEATSATAGDLMGQLFGEDMGILAAALETLEMEDADDEEELSFDLELEEKLYTTLEETMARLEAMPEPEAIPYQKDDVKWERFGILLSGILSTLNSHDLDSMDVEEHIPVMEQKIVSLVRRSWGIDGRSDLLDMIWRRRVISCGISFIVRHLRRRNSWTKLWTRMTVSLPAGHGGLHNGIKVNMLPVLWLDGILAGRRC